VLGAELITRVLLKRVEPEARPGGRPTSINPVCGLEPNLYPPHP
jgi:hypothetical protein